MAPKSAKADLGGEPEVHFAGKRFAFQLVEKPIARVILPQLATSLLK